MTMIETLQPMLVGIFGIIMVLCYIYSGIEAAHRFRKDGYVEWKYFLFLSPVMLMYAIVYWCLYIVRKIIAFRNKRN